MKFYPIQFEPIFKERIWGGTKLKSTLNKNFHQNNIGESWELSTVDGDISVVANGIFKGKAFNEIIDKHPEEILGKVCIDKYGTKFPLLFKFLDAKEDLSIQVHPNDELAEARHNSSGKTEMWYVMQADENARLVVGFNKSVNKETYIQHLESCSLLEILKEVPVKKGDTFILENGTVHAIGAGVLIAEIQQTSDVTYRLYDWERLDANGLSRELHTEFALDAINFNEIQSKKEYSSKINETISIVSCAYFNTAIIEVENQFFWKKSNDFFTVFMCTEGNFSLELNSEIYSYKKGDTVFIPAKIEEFILKGKATLLEVTI